MKESLKELKNVRFVELRNYISNYIEEANECFHKKSLYQLIDTHQELYSQCLKALYFSKNYEELEEHLRMMNFLFSNQLYNQIKKELFNKLYERYIGLDEYLVIRHLIDFNCISFETFIGELSLKTETMDIIKICIIEDEYDLAYHYLKLLDHCDNEAVLDLLFQYSPTLYIKLMIHYKSLNRYVLTLQQ